MATSTQSTRSRARANIALGLTVLVVLLAIPGTAWAAAPMCDETAMSIAAPFPIYPSDNGTIDALPCDALSFERLDDAPVPQQEGSAEALASVDRVIPSGSAWLPGLKGIRQQIPKAAHYRCPPEHSRNVYRPPRG